MVQIFVPVLKYIILFILLIQFGMKKYMMIEIAPMIIMVKVFTLLPNALIDATITIYIIINKEKLVYTLIKLQHYHVVILLYNFNSAIQQNISV